MTTHPAVVWPLPKCFAIGAREVIVGEAPGHVRDTEMALVESGMQAALDDARLPFADLNYEDVVWTPNRGGASKLGGFYFPRSVAEADLIVSLPKMKTHHWVGMTAAMKNLYGTIPGIVYGWPKNVLHHAGIPQTVYDINASLPQDARHRRRHSVHGRRRPDHGQPEADGPDSDRSECHGGRRDRGANHESAAGKYQLFGAGGGSPGADRRSRTSSNAANTGEGLVNPFSILDAPHLRNLPADPSVLISKVSRSAAATA